MKYLPFILTGVVSILISLTGDWAIRVYLFKETSSRRPEKITSNPNFLQPPLAAKPQISPWDEYHNAREQALRDNPDLAAEYQSLRAEIEQQRKDMDVAMIKADPKVAPILAKLELLRKSASSPGNAPSGSTNGTTTR